MKSRMIALILALSAMTWAQTASQNPTPQASTAASPKAECCCDKAAAKDAQSCCAYHNMSAKDGKEAMPCCGKDSTSCCNGKDGASCKRAAKDKTATNCSDCMKACGKDCCKAAKSNDVKTSASCCKEHCDGHASMGGGN